MLAALGTLALNVIAPIVASVAADQINKAMQPDEAEVADTSKNQPQLNAKSSADEGQKAVQANLDDVSSKLV